MMIRNKTLTLTALAIACSPALAQQSDDELEAQMREAEMRLSEEEVRELERSTEVLAVEAMEVARQATVESEEVEVRMREAERRMAEAARQVAELSMRQLPRVQHIERIIRSNDGPVLGVTIGALAVGGPVKGLEIMGVTPGGAAAESGLRAGDVITSINGESLAGDNGKQSAGKLLDFMQGVEEGDELEIEYLRNGKDYTVALTPRPIERDVFAFQFDDKDLTSPDVEVHLAPGVRGQDHEFVWIGHDGGFGDMEMVKLTDRLGTYFGTDEGLLVVRAPSNKELKLEDGDVILNIDGRKPGSVSHAVRILGSYQGGEELKIEIMRDKRKRSVDITVPDNRRSWSGPPAAPRATLAPGAPVAPGPVIATGDEQI
jgi:S1-C subfamily serine protease